MHAGPDNDKDEDDHDDLVDDRVDHGHAQPVATGELLVRAAGQLEGDLVRGGKRARLRVVVDRPHVRPDQQRVQFCIRGREELFVLSIVRFPQG